MTRRSLFSRLASAIVAVFVAKKVKAKSGYQMFTLPDELLEYKRYRVYSWCSIGNGWELRFETVDQSSVSCRDAFAYSKKLTESGESTIVSTFALSESQLYDKNLMRGL